MGAIGWIWCIAAQTAGGRFGARPLLEIDGQELDQGYAAYLRGTWNLLKAVGPTLLAQRRGTFLQIGTSSGVRTKDGFAALGAIQHGLRALVQVAAREWRGQGVHVAYLPIDGGIASDKTAGLDGEVRRGQGHPPGRDRPRLRVPAPPGPARLDPRTAAAARPDRLDRPDLNRRFIAWFAALLVLAACAGGATTSGYQPCGAGQTWVQPGAGGEAYGEDGVEGGVEGGVVPDGKNTGVLKVLGNPAEAPGVAPRLADVTIDRVELVHTSLGRGAISDGIAHVKYPPGSQLTLHARSTVSGYGFRIRVWRNRTQLWVRCKQDRPRHIVDWSFVLRDDQGRESNTISVPVTCTGEPIPGTSPQLDSVALAHDNMIGGQRAGGVAKLRGTHPPLQLIAASNASGYGWKSSPVREQQTALDFAVGCRNDRPSQTVVWRFSVRDSFGRTSNVIEKPVHCGICR